MNPFDESLLELSAKIDALPRSRVTALFLACAAGLRPRFDEWVARSQAQTGPLLDQASAIGRTFAIGGDTPDDVHELLARIESATPEGESPDEFSPTAAQDCWICADIAIRVIADSQYSAGAGIEYALEPVVQDATERVHGVSQLGSSPDEDAEMQQVLEQPDVIQAMQFVVFALDHLNGHSPLRDADLDELIEQATALTPRS